MSKFIILTNARTDIGLSFEASIRIQAQHIVGYATGEEGTFNIAEGKNVRHRGTWVDTVSKEGAYLVTETPEQIDAMLGVTEERETYRLRHGSDVVFTVTAEDRTLRWIADGQGAPAGWWRYEHTDVDAQGKFDLLHRARATTPAE